MSSHGSPLAMAARNRSSTRGSSLGSWTDCQPQPSICSGVAPVNSYHRRLYQKIDPSGPAIQASCGIESARVRNRSSLSCKSRSARRRSSTSAQRLIGARQLGGALLDPALQLLGAAHRQRRGVTGTSAITVPHDTIAVKSLSTPPADTPATRR